MRLLNVTFQIHDDGQVDASLEGDWPVFNDALKDSVSSLPPRGETGLGPSTYWIDRADQGSRRAASSGDGKPFLWGNYTHLSVRSGKVVAAYDFGDERDSAEAISLEDFLRLLDEWRKRVIARKTISTVALADTYRRNPMGNR